ncbi:collagen triple helix repeat domain protein [Enhygromyxa salina]|uniref:Collagen triple helix repeat domain protein n=1 Tax=Enhygromyxa salina TaxID=215803 RepID=A0A0C1Z911_9BACT|nr:hypothetical protein [Enhygromyxa salina]KIG14094.1 collagen triple helix repeat domain protein [Enhygromyxa salina]
MSDIDEPPRHTRMLMASPPRPPIVVLSLASLALISCTTPAAEDGETSSDSATDSSTDESSETTPPTDTDTDTGTDTTSDTDADPPRPARLLVTSDWRAKRLSLLDYAALRDGAQTRDDALWKSIDLGAYEPGPLEAEITPDGKLAVVAVSPGFFASAVGGLAGAGQGTVPEGGVLLIVEIDTGAVLAVLDTAQYPMGIAITEDSSAAWTANYGGNGQSGTTMSHIDLTSLSIVEEFDIGPSPEQIALNGELAIINTAGDGSVRLFGINDPVGTMSAPAMVSNDPSGVLFVGPGASEAIVVNSVGPPGYSLLDIADPSTPTVLDTVEVIGIPYAATHGSTDTQIILSVLVGLEVSLLRYETTTSTLVDQIDIPAMGFPLGIVFDPVDELAFVPIPGANVLAIADFATGTAREIDWQDDAGPTYVALE